MPNLASFKTKEQRNQWYQEYRRKKRIETVTHYGGQKPTCACCGEQDIERLTIDHVEPRSKTKAAKQHSSREIYYLLKKNGYPVGIQILCMTCNQSKGKTDKCRKH